MYITSYNAYKCLEITMGISLNWKVNLFALRTYVFFNIWNCFQRIQFVLKLVFPVLAALTMATMPRCNKRHLKVTAAIYLKPYICRSKLFWKPDPNFVRLASLFTKVSRLKILTNELLKKKITINKHRTIYK